MSKGKKAPHLTAVGDRSGAPDVRPVDRAQPSIAELERYATLLRIDCVRMLAVAKSGHLDSSLSAADIVTALYYRLLRHDPERPQWPGRDRFVLSKGHAAPIQYAALARHGYFPMEDLMGLRKLDAHLQGHPDMTRTPGIEVWTLPVTVRVASGASIFGSKVSMSCGVSPRPMNFTGMLSWSLIAKTTPQYGSGSPICRRRPSLPPTRR